MIAVIDYNMGNVGSILNMLKKLGFDTKLTRTPAELLEADGLVLPGVGAFDSGMTNLRDFGLIDTLNRCVFERSKPLLGICLGMQLLTERSEEGVMPGLGWIAGSTKRFALSTDRQWKIPHMGWNQVKPCTAARPGDSLAEVLFANTEPDQRYYFVHSYHAVCESSRDVLATSQYGYEFAAAIGRGNVAGTQFHPEKSHRYGLRLMENFARYATTRSTHVAGRTG